jgi:hypothetical protein
MPDRKEAALLKRIATIRDLQRDAAQAQAARAAATLCEAQNLHDERARTRQSAEAGWMASLSLPPLHMEAAALWSAALLREDQGVRRALADIDQATSELALCTAHWRAATNRSDAARDMAKAAVRDKNRRREESSLDEAADRHAQRWSRQ